MYNNFKEQAIEYVKQAVQEDIAGNYAKAFPLYMNALEYFKTHLKYEKNPKIKEAIAQKFTEYLRRAEEIRAVLDDGGPGPASNGDASVATRPKTKPKNGDGDGEEWISLLSGSSSKTSPMSVRSSTLPGDKLAEKLNGLLEELKGFFKYSFDDLYSNPEVRNKLIRVVKELQTSRKRLPLIHRGHINTLHEFVEELIPKLLELDSSIPPYQQAITAKHELRDKLMRLRQKQSALVEKGAPHQAMIPELEQNVARLKQELAVAESQLQEAIKASCSEEIAALDQEMSNSTAEAQTILSKVEALEVCYVNAEDTKMELATTWEDIRNIPL